MAFRHNGYSLLQTCVSERILNNLEPGVRLRCTSVFPSEANIRNSLPAKRKVNVDVLKFLALDGMAYTPRPVMAPRRQADPVPGEAALHDGNHNSDESVFMMQDSPMASQTGWAGRLRRLPSRIVASVESASASQDPPQPPYPSSAASSSQPCPSSMMHPVRLHTPRPAVTAAIDRPQVPKARAMAMARRRM